MEARVDRAVRRGDLSQARADLVELLESFPDDARLKSRLEAFESTALPGELLPPRPAAAPAPASLPESPEVIAEQRVQAGDLAGALAAYRQAVKDHPENDLFRERLAELFEQVRMEAAPAPGVPDEAGASAGVNAGAQANVPERGAQEDPGAPSGALTAISDVATHSAATTTIGVAPLTPTATTAAQAGDPFGAEPSDAPSQTDVASAGPDTGSTTRAAPEPLERTFPASAPDRSAEPAAEASVDDAASRSGPLPHTSPEVADPGADPSGGHRHDPVARLEQLLERLQTRGRRH